MNQRTVPMIMLQHEFGHIIQYRMIGPKAYYSIIAKESFASAAFSKVYPSYSHDYFWTETWANYLSKGYFGKKWLGGDKFGYPAKNISPFYLYQIIMAGLFL